MSASTPFDVLARLETLLANLPDLERQWPEGRSERLRRAITWLYDQLARCGSTQDWEKLSADLLGIAGQFGIRHMVLAGPSTPGHDPVLPGLSTLGTEFRGTVDGVPESESVRGMLLSKQNVLLARISRFLGRPVRPIAPILTYPELRPSASAIPLHTRFGLTVTPRAQPSPSAPTPLLLARSAPGPVTLEVSLLLPPNGVLEPIGLTTHPLLIPEEGDGSGLCFELIARAVGEHTIHVSFRLEGVELEPLPVSVLVLEAEPESTPPPGPPVASAGICLLSEPVLGWVLDLKLLEAGARFRFYEVTLKPSGLDGPAVKGTMHLPAEFPALLFQLCKDLLSVREAHQLETREKRLRGVGAALARQVLPEKVLEALWQAGQTPGTALHIQADDAWLPWEAMLIGTRAAGFFLGESFAVTRWLRTAPLREQLLPGQALLVAPNDSGLNPGHEREALEALFATSPRELQTLHQVLESLEAGPGAGLWHFGCHGISAATPLGGALKLQHGERLRHTDVPARGEVDHPPLAGAFVVLNACESGLPAESLWGAGSWVERFVEAGVASILATSWSVSDGGAAAMTTSLYGQLEPEKWSTEAQPPRLAEVVRLARCTLAGSGDPTRLAYALFAAPTARVWVQRPVKGE